MGNSPTTEQLKLWDHIEVEEWECAATKRIALPTKLSSLRQKLYQKAWLEAPIVEDGGHGGKEVYRSSKGTPQGGVISALLANVYLHWFEKGFYAASGPGARAKARIVRYADDFMVLARYQGSRISWRLACALW